MSAQCIAESTCNEGDIEQSPLAYLAAVDLSGNAREVDGDGTVGLLDALVALQDCLGLGCFARQPLVWG